MLSIDFGKFGKNETYSTEWVKESGKCTVFLCQCFSHYLAFPLYPFESLDPVSTCRKAQWYVEEYDQCSTATEKHPSWKDAQCRFWGLLPYWGNCWPYGHQSSSTFRETATVTVYLTFHLPFQNITNDRKWQCLPFLFKYFMSVWKMFKRCIFRLAWAEGVQLYRQDSGWLNFSANWFRKQPKLEVNFWTDLIAKPRSWNWHSFTVCESFAFWWLNLHLCHSSWVVWAWNQRWSSPSESLCSVSVLILCRFQLSTPQPRKLLPR